MICSSSLCSAFTSGVLPPSGEIGIVERSTWEAGLPLWVGASRVVVAIAGFREDVGAIYVEMENLDEFIDSRGRK